MLEEFERLFRVNQLGCFLGMRAVARTMRKNGGGSIVNITSIHGRFGEELALAYDTAKGGLDGMTRALATDGQSRAGMSLWFTAWLLNPAALTPGEWEQSWA